MDKLIKMKGMLKRRFAVSFSFLFLLSGQVIAAEIACDKPKDSAAYTLPLDFVLPLPTVPSTITVGDTVDLVYTMVNNTNNFTIDVTGTVTGTPVGQATVTPSAGCTALVPHDNTSCTLTVSITPTVAGAANLVLSANYTINGTGDPSCFDDITSDISYTAIVVNDYAYVTNGDTDEVTVCAVDQTTGLLSGCVDSGVGATFSTPTGIAIPGTFFKSFRDTSYAYVSNGLTNSVSQCEIDPATGLFTPASMACPDSGAGNIFSQPTGIDFQSASGTLYAYVVDSSALDLTSPGVTQCEVSSSDGTFSSCVDAAPIFSGPIGIDMETFAGADYMYIANSTGNNVSKCTVDLSTGGLSACFDSGAGAVFTTPTDIATFTSTNDYAYVTDSTANAVWQCNIDVSGTGALSACATTGSGFSTPTGISFQTLSSDNYAFVADFSGNTLTSCVVNPGPTNDGNLNSCNNYSLVSTQGLLGMTQQTFAGVDYIYVANSSGPRILQCKVYDNDPTPGQIYCIDSGAGPIFGLPASVIFQVVNSNTYAYIGDVGLGEVWQCLVNTTTGQFSGCINGGPIGFEQPFTVTFATISSTLYAYVSDSSFGMVWRCNVDPTTGLLCDCADAAQNIGSPAGTPPYVNPVGVSHQVFGGVDYIYVGDVANNAIYQCELDSSSGLFAGGAGGCPDSGAGTSVFNEPGNFTFETVSGTEYVYVPNINSTGSTDLTYCVVNTSTGVFSSCTDLPFGQAQAGIAFDTVSSVLYAYITVGTEISAQIVSCTVESDGSLTSCGSPFGNPISIEFTGVSASAGTRIAYVVQDGGSGVLACTIQDSTGSVLSCSDSGAGFIFTTPTDIILQEVAGTTFAYVSDSTLNTVTQCAFNPSTAVLSSCADSGAGAAFTAPLGIAFDLVNSGADLYAYVTDENTNTVTQCNVSLTAGPTLGQFSSCVSTGTSFVRPLDIAFEVVTGTTYAYITDKDMATVVVCQQNATTGILEACNNSAADTVDLTNAGGIALFTDGDAVLNVYVTDATSPGSVSFCEIDVSTGLLETLTCADSGAGAVFDSPASIIFQTFMTTPYVYIANVNDNGGTILNVVTQCTLNADGTFNVCGDSGAGTIFAAPFGIAFFTQ